MKAVETRVTVMQVYAYPQLDLVLVTALLQKTIMPRLQATPIPKSSDNRIQLEMLDMGEKMFHKLAGKVQGFGVTLLFTTKEFEELGRPNIEDELVITSQRPEVR